MLRVVKYIFLTFLSCIFFTWFFLLMNRWEDPYKDILENDEIFNSRIIDSLTVIKDNQEIRRYISMQIHSLKLGKSNIDFHLSLPQHIDTLLPVLFIVGGLNDGRTYLDLMPEHGKNVIVGFRYPNNRPFWEDQLEEADYEAVRQNMMRVPGHVSIIMNWLTQQSYVDTSRINYLGYSLGAIFGPSAIHTAQRNGYRFKTVSIIYGGVDLDRLISTNLKIKPKWLRSPIAWTISSMIYGLEPNQHIQQLESDFLLINGELDKKIPIELAKVMQESYPEPKTIINIPEKHMHPKRVELTNKLVQMSLDWLREKRAIN